MTRTALAVALVLAVALPGCFGGDDDKPAPPKDQMVITLPRRAEPPIDRAALRDALDERKVQATIRRASGAERAITIARADGTASATMAFDEELAGKLQAQGLVDCMGTLRGQRIAFVGAPDDLVRKGQDYILDPLFAQDVLHRVDNHEQADGVLADDRALAGRLKSGAAVAAHGVTTGILRDIVAGRWCLTIYEAPERIARATAAQAEAMASGEPAPPRPVRLTPATINLDTVEHHLDDPGFPTRDEVCAGSLAARCKELGL